MGMASPVYYTADMVRALPEDGNRYESVRGELLVTPSPKLWHQEIVLRIARILAEYVDRNPVGRVLTAPADISWSSDTLVQPDVFVADLNEARTLDWNKVKRLLLTVEVLSPTTVRYDRFTKRRLYQEVGIPIYWTVDPDEQLVEVWTPGDLQPATCRDRVTWSPVGAEQPLEIRLSELFKAI